MKIKEMIHQVVKVSKKLMCQLLIIHNRQLATSKSNQPAFKTKKDCR
jgi:hypothetical protein